MKNKIVKALVALIISVTFLLPKNAYASILSGVDVYEGNNINDYAVLKASGTDIIIQKATQGKHIDNLLYYRSQQAQKFGFKIGYYCFANNTGNPEEQAQFFLNTVRNLKSDTVLFLDIENESNWSKQAAISFSNEFIQCIQSQGYKAGLYTSLYFFKDYLKGNIPDVPLWIASYSDKCSMFPENSWQYSESGSINGVIGAIDLDFFNSNILLDESTVINKPVATPIITDSKTLVLQQNLRHLLQWNILVDGIYGNQTKQAVKQLQRMTNIQIDGIAGNQTNSVINTIMSKPTLKQGSRGTAVRYLQYRLGINADGIFGIQTRQAVMRYQRQHKLQVDGIIGQQSWSELLK